MGEGGGTAMGGGGRNNHGEGGGTAMGEEGAWGRRRRQLWIISRFFFSFSVRMASIHSFFSSGVLAMRTNHLSLAMLCTFQLLVTVIPLVWKSAGEG